jgi:hypothetical protein
MKHSGKFSFVNQIEYWNFLKNTNDILREQIKKFDYLNYKVKIDKEKNNNENENKNEDNSKNNNNISSNFYPNLNLNLFNQSNFYIEKIKNVFKDDDMNITININKKFPNSNFSDSFINYDFKSKCLLKNLDSGISLFNNFDNYNKFNTKNINIYFKTNMDKISYFYEK